MTRRDFIQDSLALTTAGALGAATSNAAQPSAQAPAGNCPLGKIGTLQLSRLILGSNLITFYIHSRGLKFVNTLARHYNTEEKILETLAVAEKHGVTAIMTQADPRYLGILKKYRDTCGGKLQWIVSPKITGTPADGETINRLVDEGVAAMYVHGVQADAFCAKGNRDPIARAIEFIKMNDMPAGVAAHDLKVIEMCEKPDLGADFYLKTFHHHKYADAPRPEDLKGPHAENPGYWCKDPIETANVMKAVNKPWVAFKVMAAGAIPPRDAFAYSFQNGADFILAGMFDFEIAEDVQLARETFAAAANRSRPWR